MSSGAAAVPEPATLNDHDIEGSPVKGSRAEGESLAGGCYNPHVHGGQALALLQKSRQNMVGLATIANLCLRLWKLLHGSSCYT